MFGPNTWTPKIGVSDPVDLIGRRYEFPPVWPERIVSASSRGDGAPVSEYGVGEAATIVDDQLSGADACTCWIGSSLSLSPSVTVRIERERRS